MRDYPVLTSLAEQQRQYAVIAKERADKMAAAAQAAYNQRVLEGLKSFSGVHNDPNAPHWDEMDDDDDLEDILEFADGMRYEVPPTAALPTEAETAAFEEAEKASHEAAALQIEYERQAAAEEAAEAAVAAIKAGTAKSEAGEARPLPPQAEPVEEVPVSKAERFTDDFDRGARGSPVVIPAAGKDAHISRSLFNERLGRFEPYAGRGPAPPRKERRTSPPIVLSKPPGRPSELNEAPTARLAQAQHRPSNGNPQIEGALPSLSPIATKHARKPSAPAAAKVNLQPPLGAPSPAVAKVNPDIQPIPRKIESPWAKLPAVPKLPPPGSEIAAATPSTSLKTAPVAVPRSAPLPVLADVPIAPKPKPSITIAPEEDPEEAYKREMQTHAERARRRRQDEEVERQAQIDRAKRKAAEIEEKMNEASTIASSTIRSEPISILPPPVPSIGSPSIDQEVSWRRKSVSNSIKQVPVYSMNQQRTLLQPLKSALNEDDRQESTAKGQMPTSVPESKVFPSPVVRGPPSSAAFAALANMATSTWRKPSTSSSLPLASTIPQATEPTISRQTLSAPLTALPVAIVATDESNTAVTSSDASTARLAANLHTSQPQLSTTLQSPIPRVRLGRTVPIPASAWVPSIIQEEIEAAQAQPHLHPSSMAPYSLSSTSSEDVLSSSNVYPSEESLAPPQLSALDKIMLQVRSAQADLKAKQLALSLLEGEKRKVNVGNGQDQFDGALSRISQALGEAALRKEKARELSPDTRMPQMRYIPETFQVTQIERPSSPRSWKTFNVRFPPLKRQLTLPPKARLQGFEDPLLPQGVYPSSWRLPKGQKISRDISQEEYLFPRPSRDTQVIVKMSGIYCPAAKPRPDMDIAFDQEVADPFPISLSPTSPNESIRMRSEVSNWRRKERIDDMIIPSSGVLEQQEVSAEPPMPVYNTNYLEEDFMTIPFEEFSASPTLIKVSLPKSTTAGMTALLSNTASENTRSPDIDRFGSYGYKLSDQATVAFARSSSVNLDSLASKRATSNDMTMVSSEIEELAKEEEVQQVLPAEMTAAHLAAQMSEENPALPPMNVFSSSRLEETDASMPSAVSPLPPANSSSQRYLGDTPNARAATPLSPAPYDLGRKFDIPKEVQQELDRLNAAVGTVRTSRCMGKGSDLLNAFKGPSHRSSTPRLALFLHEAHSIAMGQR